MSKANCGETAIVDSYDLENILMYTLESHQDIFDKNFPTASEFLTWPSMRLVWAHLLFSVF